MRRQNKLSQDQDPAFRDLEVTSRDVDALEPFGRNARTHSRKQIRQIAESIRAFGFTNPILIDETDRIIAGHGRVAAARLLGITQVPTIRLEHLSEARLRAYVIADNHRPAKPYCKKGRPRYSGMPRGYSATRPSLRTTRRW